MLTTSVPIPVVDVFAGAGGLGEGFGAFASRTSPEFRVALSIEKDAAAVRTLRLRALYRAFAPEAVPSDYYRVLAGTVTPGPIEAYLNGELTLADILATYESPLPLTPGDVWHTELRDSPELERELDQRIVRATEGRSDWVLVGGPPCQPFSTAGRPRQRSLEGYTLETDPRHELYREYLRIIVRHWPAVFVMENVRGILSAKVEGNLIFERILEDLDDPAHAFGGQIDSAGTRHTYQLWPLEQSATTTLDLFGRHAAPEGYVIESERHGIPQMRHRVILLGVRDDIDVHARPLKVRPGKPATVASVIGGLPRLRSGIARTPDSREQWRKIVAAARPGAASLTPEDTEDVTDSDAQWVRILQSAEDEPWFQELEAMGQGDVATRLRTVLKNLKPPRSGRGRGTLPAKVRWSEDQKEPELKSWLNDVHMDSVCNHETREHMPTDHHRYLFAAAFAAVRGVSPRLRDFPRGLLPEHNNVSASLGHANFADRFRVQVADQPGSTVLSHIAKDGHYFIHPDPSQARSLTVREVARLQTFPDNYAFFGNRSEQYTQIGNAVPPLLSFQIAEVVADVLSRAKPKTPAPGLNTRLSTPARTDTTPAEAGPL